MTDHEQLETMLRSSLTERAGDVDTTPALYERVQRQASRGTWLRRAVALAGAAAAVVVAVAVIPPLLPAGPLEPDIADTPDAVDPTEPSVDPSVDEDAGPGDGAATFAAAMAAAGLAWSDGETIHIGDRQLAATVLIEDGSAADGTGARTTALAVEPGPDSDDRHVAAVMRSDAGVTSIGWTRIGGMDGNDPGHFGGITAATPNGDGVTFIPGDMPALAWIEGTDLHLQALDGSFDRVHPLEGEIPDDLVAQQWVAQADAQVLFASDPDGGLWALPMDDSNAANTGPTGPAFLLEGTEDTVDGVLRPDLARVDLEIFPDGSAPARLRAGDASPTPLPGDLASSTAVRLIGNGSWLVAVNDPSSGDGALLHLDDTGRYMPGYSWGAQETPVTAVAPLRVEDQPGTPVDVAEDDSAGDVAEGDSTLLEGLGLQPLPLVGTRGTDLLVVDAVSGSETVVPVYPGETEAALGLLDVRPGSTVGEAVVAYENFSEGETSIRFLALRDREVELLDGLVVADAPLTGLVWSPDAMHVLWTTEAGAVGVADVTTTDGTISTSSLEDLAGQGLVATDWTWDDSDPSGDAEGQLWFSTGQGAEGSTELVSVARSQAAGVAVADAERQVLRGVAVSPVDGSSVSLQDFENRLELLLMLDDDRLQYLPLPAFLEDASDAWPGLTMDAVDGSVVIWTDEGSSFEVRLTGEGEVRNLPDATAWTPVG